MSDPRDELARLTALCEKATAGYPALAGYREGELLAALPTALACLTELLNQKAKDVANVPGDAEWVDGYNTAIEQIRAVIAKHFPGSSHE